jgi:thermitase
MRFLPTSAASIALLTLLTACHQASPLAPTAEVRTGASTAAKSVAGRLLVKWKAKGLGATILSKLKAGAHEAIGDAGTTELVELPAGMSVEEFKRAAGDEIAYAEPDYIFRAVTSTPIDPLVKQQWSLKKVHAAEAWQVTRGSADVKIAIVDTGCDLNHPDLKGQIVGSANMIGWRGAFASAKDENGHGTHCAGIAAGAINGQGISGMAPGCKLLIAKALGADGAGATSDIAKGIHWAVKQGADVISLSIGGEEDAAVLKDAVDEALSKGIVVVSAMGNEGKTLKNYPAAYPGVIAVGSTNPQDGVSSFSTRGSWISVAAPGANILSTTPTYGVSLNRSENGGLERMYGKLSGTSMATPLVAGLAALVKSKYPRYTPAQVKKAIERSAVAIAPKFNPNSGYGRVDAAAALR